LLVEASYARTPAEVETLLGAEVWDQIWLADDAVGERAIALLAERYLEQGRAERQRRGTDRYRYLLLPGAPETAMIGYFQGLTSPLHEAGLRVSCPPEDVYAEGYQAFRAEQRARAAKRT
jgi:hypothetical protein